MINPKSVTVGEVLSLSTQFVVPRYQRGYAWNKGEASEFLDDLLSEAEVGRGLFLGTLIFDVAAEASQKKITIVDGQQRLTTILLLLIACRRLARTLNSPEMAGVIQQRISFVNPTTAKSEGPLLIASESIRDVFDKMANSDWSGPVPTKNDKGKSIKRQANRVGPVYEFFGDSIRNHDLQELSRLLEAIYNSRVIRIDIEGEEEAFTIFERTNARGADLEISDLLKNYLYQQGVPDLDEKWTQIINNSDGTLIKMLKYFYVSKRGYISKSELYRKLKDYCKSIGGAAQLVEELSQFSEFYAAARKEEGEQVIKKYFEDIGATEISGYQDRYGQIHICLQGLRLFRVSQIYPLIYSAINCFVRNEGGKSPSQGRALVRLFQDLEKYHFVNNAICDRVGNEVEKLYANYSVTYSNSDDFVTTTNDLVKELRTRLANESEFSTRFCDISYSPESIPLIAYIFDRISNFGVAPGERVSLYNPGHVRANHNIEHFYPQKPSNGNADADALEAVDNIGNLLAISFGANSSLGNLSPVEKVEKMKGVLGKKLQNLPYIQEFLEKYEKHAPTWGKTAITTRAAELAQTAYRKVWKIN